jgi:drug/metabolite transporter (DMT)-like permease
MGSGRGKIGGQRLLGVILCLIGGCSWLRREYLRQQRYDKGLHDDNDDEGGHVNMVYGDFLAVSAACIYGLNDVLAEYFLKQASNTDVEYIGMLGFFGSLFSLCVQAPFLGEWDRIRTLLQEMMHHDDSTKSTETILLLFLSFIIMLYYFYTQAMRYMSRYDATSLNLSVQTGPLWAVAIELFSIGGGFPPLMFFVSFAMILVGVFLYEDSTTDNNRSGCVVDKDYDSRGNSH